MIKHNEKNIVITTIMAKLQWKHVIVPTGGKYQLRKKYTEKMDQPIQQLEK